MRYAEIFMCIITGNNVVKTSLYWNDNNKYIKVKILPKTYNKQLGNWIRLDTNTHTKTVLRLICQQIWPALSLNINDIGFGCLV